MLNSHEKHESTFQESHSVEYKVTDVLALLLHHAGIENFFAVTGGAAVHIIDSLTYTGGLEPIFHHHEQAAAMAADAYARVKGFGVCVVTTGPGVTNALTGLLCAWQDSTPMIFISGQARLNKTSRGRSLRQVGTQHLEVLPLVSPLTKAAVMLRNPNDLIETVKELITLAKSGRPGPVWLDIPLDIQLSQVECARSELRFPEFNWNGSVKIPKIDYGLLRNRIRSSTRPVLVLGRGTNKVSTAKLTKFIADFELPVVRTWGGMRTRLPESQEEFGRIGVSGQRGANLILGQSDLAIFLGVRLGQAVVGPSVEHLVPSGELLVVDIDSEELDFLMSQCAVTALNVDVNHFLSGVLTDSVIGTASRTSWLKYCRQASSWNHETRLYEKEDPKPDIYEVIRELDLLMPAEDFIIVDGGGTVVYASMQTLSVRVGLNTVIPSGSAPMGTGIPQGIGVAKAVAGSQVVVLCGDGSFQFNVQELQTIVQEQLNMKILVFNNDGYVSIRGTQEQFLGSRFLGSAREGKLTIPSIEAVTKAYGLNFTSISNRNDLCLNMKHFLSSEGPGICEIAIRPDQQISPRQGFALQTDGKYVAEPLTRMAPLHFDSFLYSD